MDFVGKTVKKEFKGFGITSGIVKSYDSSSGCFEVEYESGDSEEMDFSEVSLLLDAEAQLVEDRFRSGRKPKKRRRMHVKREIRGESCHSSGNLVNVEVDHVRTLDMNLRISVSDDGNSNENSQLSEGLHDGCLKETLDVNGNSNLNCSVDVNKSDRFDLNAGFNLNEGFNLNDGCDLHASPKKSKLKTKGSIDLNLDATGEFDEISNGGEKSSFVGKMKEIKCYFDLNLEVGDEIEDTEDDSRGELDVSMSTEIVEESRDREKNVCENSEGKFMEGGIANGNLKEDQMGNTQKLSVKSVCEFPEKASTVLVEGMKEENIVLGGDVNANSSVKVSDSICINDSTLFEVELKDGLTDPGITLIRGFECTIDSEHKQLNRQRKRGILSDNLMSTPETALRRSKRRASAQNHILISPCTFDDPPLSPLVNEVPKEKSDTSSSIESEKPVVLPPKLLLPPSSQKLNLDDIPILDLFSIYACLRSFSTLLFLSPFELDDFVAALKCQSPTAVFDSIHVSILQTLRKHLEYLSMEGSESASDCLRSVNWDFLDLISWPVFLVEYLLIHGSDLKPGFDLSHLKLFKMDYYKLPISAKVEILRCLCDDVIEGEAIRSEINRRSLAAESDIVLDRSDKFEVYRKTKNPVDVSGGSCLADQVMDDAADWNSDECCLCKMDGSLICCDGCPAAYHSKCVGISSDLLPEGDWYCPECAIDRLTPGMKPKKSVQGADLLGIDPHGRLYFSTFGYLLVSDSCNSESSFHYYHKNDLDVVIEVLRSSYVFYGEILSAICRQWDIPLSSCEKLRKTDSPYRTGGSDVLTKGEASTISVPFTHLRSSDLCVVKHDAEYSDNCGMNFSDLMMIMDGRDTTTEESAPATEMNSGFRNHKENWQKHSNRSSEFLNKDASPADLLSVEDSSLTHPDLDGRQGRVRDSFGPDITSSTITIRKADSPKVDNRNGYMNLYSFAQMAASVSEELMRKSSDKIKEEPMITKEEITAAQMKVMLKKTTKFSWPITCSINLAAKKEKCGWCFSCKAPSDDVDCLFNAIIGPVEEGFKGDRTSLQSDSHSEGHLTDVTCQILSVVDRLHGLLVCPLLNSQHRKLWHKSISKPCDLTSLKHLLLTVESNLHHLALSAEWFKHVDSAVTLGSSSHIMTASARGKKKARSSDVESHPCSNLAGRLGIFWWRGGRLSRKVFNWKVMPRTLASKAARQGGCRKIPGILYPEGSEHAKRSRCIAWRAAVENSISVQQLALQIRELDSFIKWDDIENTHALPTLDKESRKSIRLFKKVIIRRKSVEKGVIKYLLDFGKRRVIPDVVKKHGTVLEDSCSEKKRYWLDQTHVPLHLLKNFEEKRISRKSNEVKSGNSFEVGKVYALQRKGFDYLFSKSEKIEFYLCGQCNKDVPVREAVSCQYCKGFFHKRHVRKFSAFITSECTYTCQRCRDKVGVKVDTKREKSEMKCGMVKKEKSRNVSADYRSLRLRGNKKVSRAGRPLQSKNKKKVLSSVPLRRSSRKVKCLYVLPKKQGKKVVLGRKRKRTKSIKVTPKKTPKKQKRSSSWKKKRTPMYHSYWLNGLFLSRKSNKERSMCFQKKKLFAPSQPWSAILDQPKCHLCSEEGSPALNYISCELCGEWFHGDAFGLDSIKIDLLIGFRCHVCRRMEPPVCPHLPAAKTDGSMSAEEQNGVMVDCSEEVTNVASPKDVIACN